MELKSSYEKINYSLRPAKTIERKMFCEAMRKLAHFQNIDTYQYIGFGSPYFNEFSLIHRTNGIKEMISIEKDEWNRERFEFNKPFSCIEIIFKTSNEALQNVNWKKPTILWLDYDYRLDESMLNDINTFFLEAKPSSMFMITIDVKAEQPDNQAVSLKKLKQYRITKLKERIGRDKLPADINKRNLGIEGNIKLIHEIISDQISEILKIRNGTINKDADKIEYKQIFNFYYNDGTPMLTIGGIIFKKVQLKEFTEAEFEKLEYYRNDNTPFDIEVPKLTFKEISALDELLPNGIGRTGKIKGAFKEKSRVPKLNVEDIKKYAKVYKYFPNFTEAQF